MIRGTFLLAGTPIAVAAAGFLALPVSAGAQAPTRPWTEWRTLSTEHFDVHYPADLAAWSEATAARLEPIHEAVTAFVGYEPEERITVIVDDPLSVSNGSAWPGPVVLLWPTPPEPSSMIAISRGWSEILAVHELAHVAHFTRPTRNPRDRFLRRLSPIPIGPILTRAPRWALEGYATLVEGRLTGSGRPHGAWRPAVLRTWALEGKLPDYGGLDSTEGFLQGAMAYLVGSAYLEWLVERTDDDESLPRLWRRLTARRKRDFDEAFAGVFGGPPAELYGRFKVDVTEKALAVEGRLEAAGLQSGATFQRLGGMTDDPAVSPDGRHLAIVRQPDRELPPEVIVWTTAEDTLTTKEREARERALARDPEDVPDVEWRPRPKEPVAKLRAVGGRGHRSPRWLPNGEGILVVRPEGMGDGRIRPDLFLWRWRDGGLRRVTRGAGIHDADPEPDGRSAIGTRCLAGACDLVRIDLESGEVSVLARGEPDRRSYHRPRIAPGGARIAVSVQERGIWRLALLDREGGPIADVAPDDGATRFDAAWTPGGDALVVVSDRGGIHDLERIDLPTTVAMPLGRPAVSIRPLTRVTSAALAPAPSPDGTVFFLLLTSRGLDVQRIDPAGVDLGEIVEIEPELTPAARVPPVEAPPFAAAELPRSRSYGAGPRDLTVLPSAYGGAEGWAVGAALHGSDPVGRLGWTARGLYGAESAWRGGAATAVWRGWRPEVEAEAFWARHRPSAQDVDGPGPPGLDLDYAGGLVAIELHREFASSRRRWRAGGSAGRLAGGALDGAGRRLAFGELAGWWLQTFGRWRLLERARIHAAGGETDGEGWRRGLAEGSLAVRRGGTGLRIDALYGAADQGPAGFEAFAFGGIESPLADRALLSQRLPEPAVPAGYAAGRRAAAVGVAWESGGSETYYRWMSAGESVGRWKRVFGSEVSLDEPPLPFLGLPAIRFVLGIARVLDPPLEDETRIYGALMYR